MPPTPHPLHVSSPRPRWPGLSFLHQQAPHPIPAEITTTHRWGSLPASGWAQTGVGLGASLPCGRGGQEQDSQHPPRPTKGGLSPSHHPQWPEEVSELIRKPHRLQLPEAGAGTQGGHSIPHMNPPKSTPDRHLSPAVPVQRKLSSIHALSGSQWVGPPQAAGVRPQTRE